MYLLILYLIYMYFRAICSLQTGQFVNYHIALNSMLYLLIIITIILV